MTEIKKIIEKISAGRAAFDDKSADELFNSVADLLHNFPDLYNQEKNEINLPLWTDMLARVNSSRFGREIAARMQPDKFYSLGEFILSLSANQKGDEVLKHLIMEYLDIFRQSEFLTKIYDDRRWDFLILELIRTSNFTTGDLFKQRVRDYSSKPLFNLIKNDHIKSYSWDEISDIVNHYKKALYAGLGEYLHNEVQVAFLMDNSLDMACLDLACLTGGIVNVMVPANSVSQHIEFILNQTEAPLLIVSDEKQLSKIKSIKKNLPFLEKVILFTGLSAEKWVESFESFLSASGYSQLVKKEFEKKLKCDSLATIMYTSGTTGEPKGIMFSHTNIVYKRFCRAMALPAIGDKDKFLAYLPLFHTFGRYLELMGSVFWGADYTFMENPSIQSMLNNMKKIKPTIFISIPKKWIQLYEYIASIVDIELADDDEIKSMVGNATGGDLKWGLSAAGFLPPDVFTFFQRNGVELMSGFGMTEATGGITMTPPNKYKINSLGKALPGIEIKTADDGELLIRGEYVMMNYYKQDIKEVFDESGWLATGDIMREDENHFIEIIDRKKEIYKNVKGETVAPQKIENYFRDFESIKQVFLAGDHRPFNTLLIYPNYDDEHSPLNRMTQDEKHEYFSSLIVTVNNFLAPFERIVDFRLINRLFTLENGELTPKGTYKRRVIEENFKNLIEPMYIRNYTELLYDDLKIKIPNWFLREKGCLSNDIVIEKNKIIIPKTGVSLAIESIDEYYVLIGNYLYAYQSNSIDFQKIFINPLIWLGNNDLYNFAGDSLIQWEKNFNREKEFIFAGITRKFDVAELNVEYLGEIINSGEQSLQGLHLATLALQTEDHYELGLTFIENCIKDPDSIMQDYASELIVRAEYGKNLGVRRRMLQIAIMNLRAEALFRPINKFIENDANIIDDEIIAALNNSSRKPDKQNVLIKLLKYHTKKIENESQLEDSPVPSLFKLLSQYGIQHPSTYEKIRQVLVEYQLDYNYPYISKLAIEARNELRQGFRNWLGENQSIAVDMENGEEYGWEDVIIFEEGTDEADKTLILKAILTTPIIREAIFLISKGKVIQLNNLLPGGVWISHLRRFHHKSNYRVSIQTRFQGSFELVLHLNYNRDKKDILHEVNLLILAGSRQYLQELVEDFGGYWDEYQIWSSKYVPGDPVEKFLTREARKKDEFSISRLYHIWPFFVWNASAAYMNFWRLTGYKQILADPSLDNFIIPSHDYQTGTKVISLSQKLDFVSLLDLFRNFHSLFVEAGENRFPFLKRNKIWTFIFAGIINAEGEQKGLKILNDFKIELIRKNVLQNQNDVEKQLNDFISTVERGDFVPKQLYFAIKRFRRWKKLNEHADITAQAQMLNELYDTYRLAELLESYPEARSKLFFETIFSNSSDELKKVLMEIIEQYHNHKISEDEELSLLSNLTSQFNLNDEEKFFLTRLIYPHLKPSDSAELIEYQVDGKSASNLVVQYIDYEGMPYYIRKPISPKEISRLHQLFLEANLLVTFKPEHEYLLAISDRGFIMGGMFYQRQNEEFAHMEKIVVSNRYRRKGISDKLMNEFFERMHNDNFKFVSTGFFRPEYFYKFGFKIEKKYSGLVKELQNK